MQITKAEFAAAYNNGIIEIPNIDKTYLTDNDIGVYYTVLDGNECFFVINKIFDSFLNRDIFIQIIANLSGNIPDENLSEIKINHLKSRKLIYMASTRSYMWDRWCHEDSNIYNYLNNCLEASGANIKIKHWTNKTI